MKFYYFTYHWTTDKAAGQDTAVIQATSTISAIDLFHKQMQLECARRPADYRMAKVDQVYREGFDGKGKEVRSTVDLPNCPNPEVKRKAALDPADGQAIMDICKDLINSTP